MSSAKCLVLGVVRESVATVCLGQVRDRSDTVAEIGQGSLCADAISQYWKLRNDLLDFLIVEGATFAREIVVHGPLTCGFSDVVHALRILD